MPEDIFIRLGKRLRHVRKARGLTQEELSQLSGVSVRHISKIEKGVMNPSYEVLVQITSALGTSAEFFFAADGDDEDEANIRLLTGIYRGCPPRYRKLLISTVQTLSRELQDAERENEESGREIAIGLL